MDGTKFAASAAPDRKRTQITTPTSPSHLSKVVMRRCAVTRDEAAILPSLVVVVTHTGPTCTWYGRESGRSGRSGMKALLFQLTVDDGSGHATASDCLPCSSRPKIYLATVVRPCYTHMDLLQVVCPFHHRSLASTVPITYGHRHVDLYIDDTTTAGYIHAASGCPCNGLDPGRGPHSSTSNYHTHMPTPRNPAVRK